MLLTKDRHRFLATVALLLTAIATFPAITHAARVMSISVPTDKAHAGYRSELKLHHQHGTLTLLLNPSAVTEKLQVTQIGIDNRTRLPASYTGVVAGYANSWVRLTTESKAIDGVMAVNGTRFRLKTLDNSYTLLRPLSDPESNLENSGRLPDASLPAPDAGRSNTRQMRATTVTRATKIGIVVDSQFNDYYEGRGLQRAIAIINAVDGIYQREFGLALRLDKALLFADRDSDPFALGSVPIETMLRNFRDQRRSDPRLNDLCLVHLFTGNDNSDAPVGLAWIDTSCRTDGYDVGLSTPYRHEVLLAAHEIAHNLGADHDNNTDCRAQNNAVMWTVISSNTSDNFSACSQTAVQTALNKPGHMNAIDIGISMVDDSNSGATIAIGNSDGLRTVTSATLTVDFPDQDSVLANQFICPDITIDNTRVRCKLRNLGPGEQQTVALSITRQADKILNVFLEIESDELEDVAVHDNEAVLEFEHIDTRLRYINSTPVSSSGGSGAWSMQSLALLLLLTAIVSGRKGHRNCRIKSLRLNRQWFQSSAAANREPPG